MRNFLHHLIFSLCLCASVATAQVKISSYPAHTNLANADDLLVNKKVPGGYSTTRTAVSNLVEFTVAAVPIRTNYNRLHVTNIFVAEGLNASEVFATNYVQSPLGNFTLLNAPTLNANNATITNTVTGGTGNFTTLNVTTFNFSGVNGTNLSATNGTFGTLSSATNNASYLTVTNEARIRPFGSVLLQSSTDGNSVRISTDDSAGNIIRFTRKSDGEAVPVQFGSARLNAATGTNNSGAVIHGVSVTSDNQADHGTHIRLGEYVGIYSGQGSPEGQVTAYRGSLYLRWNGGAGTTLYVKESGTGNTGWAAK